MKKTLIKLILQLVAYCRTFYSPWLYKKFYHGKVKYNLYESEPVTLGTSESVGTNYVELLDIPASVGNGLRVVSKPFLVELYSDPATASTNSVEASAVGAYSTTITFELITP